MPAIILAAGTATRLRPLTDTIPKCLLRVGEKTILGHTIDNLQRAGEGEIILVTGYRAEQIREFLSVHYPGLRVTYIHNPRYEETNNIYSLWLTRELVPGREVLLLDSDILFDWRILPLLAGSGTRSCLAVRHDRALGEEEIKVRADARGLITAIGKEVDPAGAVGESIGIERFTGPFAAGLFRVLDRMILQEKRTTVFYEAAFQEAIDGGAEIVPVDVGTYRCIEIDTAEDLSRAGREVLPFLPGMELS